MQVDIWKMGNFYKVYSENTTFIRQIANAKECKIMCYYYFRGYLSALDAILPFNAKNGRRIVRLLNLNGFGYRERTPKLTADETLTLERVEVPVNAKNRLNQGFLNEIGEV